MHFSAGLAKRLSKHGFCLTPSMGMTNQGVMRCQIVLELAERDQKPRGQDTKGRKHRETQLVNFGAKARTSMVGGTGFEPVTPGL
jgi:hypothetical protein